MNITEKQIKGKKKKNQVTEWTKIKEKCNRISINVINGMPFVSIVSQLILVGLSVDICNLKYINMQSAAFAQSLSKLLMKNWKKKKKKFKKFYGALFNLNTVLKN